MIINTRPGFWRDLWALIHPYWKSEEKGSAWGLLIGVIALTLALVYMEVQFNQWNNAFFNSLQNKSQADFFKLMGKFGILAAIYIVLYIYSVYVNQWLQIRWRRWLTERYMTEWLYERTYYRMQLTGNGADNPDQRIAEDLKLFVENTLELVLGGLNAVVTLFAFLAILWGLSGALEFSWNGQVYEVYGYMVWVALAYAVVGTLLVHMVGKRLIPLQYDQQRYEADFRYNLVRFRENMEGVALYRGEQGELAGFRTRFGKVMTNWWAIMKRIKLLNTFRYGYNQVAIVFPYLVTAPRYFAGKFTLGDLTQTAGAFGQVQGSLSWFINVYLLFANWKATVDRLTGFHHSVMNAQADRIANPGVATRPSDRDSIALENVDLLLPTGRKLVSNVNIQFQPGARVLVRGASGSGKSTLFRAIAGIWPFGSGSITIPVGASLMMLPQRPYFPIGSLHAAVVYPSAPGAFDIERVKRVLLDVGLTQLANRMHEEAHWNRMLSLGEQQRLGVARALLHAPVFLFLDEATASLDEPSEAALYRLLAERLPSTTLISIGHRSTLEAFHTRKLVLERDGEAFALRGQAQPGVS